jgi:hypothetical protein
MLKEEYKKIIKNMDMSSLDLEGAHIKTLHCGLNDEQLKQRCKNISKDENIIGATVFDINEDEILKCIQEAFLDEEYQTPECILEWLDDESDGFYYIVTKIFNHPIGHGYYKVKWHDWSKGPIMCNEITIVLSKVERKYDTTFHVVTAYPSNCF